MDQWTEFCVINRIPPQYQEASLDSPTMAPPRVVAGGEWIQAPASLLITGNVGRGKTYFMHALMKRLISLYGRGCLRFFKSKTLDDRLLECINDFGSTQWMMESLREIPYLFIDDFGVDRSTERLERDYYDLIDDRGSWERPTVISTNLQDAEIEAKYGARITSRLRRFKGIAFGGEDLRKDLQ